MPVSEQVAKQQIKRLSRLKGFPIGEDEKPLRADLVRALQLAPSDNRAKQIIDDWLAESTECPKVADLSHLARIGTEPEFLSPFDSPGTLGWLFEGMTEEQARMWEGRAEHGKTKAARDVATAIITRYREDQKSKGAA